VETAERGAPVSRRRLFGLLGGAAAVGTGLAVAGSALTAESADATTGNMQFGASNNAGTDQTQLTASALSWTITVDNTGSDGRAVDMNTADGVPQTRLNPTFGGTHVGPPSVLAFPGDIYVDTTGALFTCLVAGTPGKWVHQSPLVTLPAPHRVFDSRVGQPNAGTGNVQGTLTFTSPPPSAAARAINVLQDSTTAAILMPPSASTVLLNLTATGTVGTGALAVYAKGASQPSTSNINWSGAGQNIANSVTSAVGFTLGIQEVDVAIVAGAGASTNFIIDLIGYYP
jgi:hypothetical protein